MGRIDLLIEMERDHGEEKKKESMDRIERRDDDQVTEIYKDYDLYLAAKNGNLADFKGILDRVSTADCGDALSRLSPAGNTFLHIASKHGNEDIVNFIASRKPSLVLSKNFNGDTALHIVAKAGNASMVKALLLIHRDLLALKPLPEVEGDENNLLRVKNDRGNTALHEALSDGWTIFECLIEEDPELLYYQNKNGESVLYFAAKHGYASFVSLALRLSTDEERLIEVFKKKSPIHAAIKWKRREVLEVMFNMKPSLIQSKDVEGRTPIHYAASLGYLEEVRFLLKQCFQNVTQRDKSGSLPIHLASINGHVDVISLLLQDFPDPRELIDREGHNILHLAAKNGRSNVVSFVLNNPKLDYLIDMKDKYENTPLHLATRSWHPKIVHALTWDKRVNVKAFNDQSMSALDVAEHYMSYNPQYSERLTWAALKAAGTPRYQSVKTVPKKKSPDRYKERVNTLLLVATLVATVTFAAGFTVPGGYNSSESNINIGMATLLREKGFHIFILCDTIAMFTSIVVVVVLIWAQLGDLALVLNAITLAIPLLGLTLGMMSMAFAAGLLIVVSKLRWLAAVFLLCLPLSMSSCFSSCSCCVLRLLQQTGCFAICPIIPSVC